MAQTQEVRGVATNISATAGVIKVRYHSTVVVEIGLSTVTLRSGGYQSATTKLRMNQAANQFDLGYGVFQKDFDWYVVLPSGETVPFQDGMTFSR